MASTPELFTAPCGTQVAFLPGTAAHAYAARTYTRVVSTSVDTPVVDAPVETLAVTVEEEPATSCECEVCEGDC